MLPNFFIVGVQKAATTSLFNYLLYHPEIYVPDTKETKFFVDDKRYAKGIDYYEETFFANWNGEPAVGEIDPDYIYFYNALERISLHINLSSTKFIFIFRNPVDRAFSHYLMTYRRGLEPLSFEDAIEQESERIEKDYFSNMHFSYVKRGYYMRQIERFLQRINRSQMFFLFMEDLEINPKDTLCKIFNFLNVDTEAVPPNIAKTFHRAQVPISMNLLHRIKGGLTFEKKIIRLLIPWKKPRHKLRKKLLELNMTKKHNILLNDTTRKNLAALYIEENRRLGVFLSRDLSHWNYGLEWNVYK